MQSLLTRARSVFKIHTQFMVPLELRPRGIPPKGFLGNFKPWVGKQHTAWHGGIPPWVGKQHTGPKHHKERGCVHGRNPVWAQFHVHHNLYIESYSVPFIRWSDATEKNSKWRREFIYQICTIVHCTYTEHYIE